MEIRGRVGGHNCQKLIDATSNLAGLTVLASVPTEAPHTGHGSLGGSFTCTVSALLRHLSLLTGVSLGL